LNFGIFPDAPSTNILKNTMNICFLSTTD